MDKIRFTKEKETLLIPLYGKAMENEKKSPILIDKKAAEIINQLDYDFTSLRIPEKTNIMMSLRAKLIDNFVRDFLESSSDNIALHLGCGLDSRYNRIENNDVDWYDIDFQEVIEIRKHFYKETDKYHLISSSATESKWLDLIPKGKGQCIVIAEGLFMYLKEAEIITILNNIVDRVESFTLVFDAFSVFAAKKVSNHPSLKKTGAKIHWGIDRPKDLEKWGMGIRFIEEQFFTTNKELDKLDAGMRIMFIIANIFPLVRKAQRLLIYKVGH